MTIEELQREIEDLRRIEMENQFRLDWLQQELLQQKLQRVKNTSLEQPLTGTQRPQQVTFAAQEKTRPDMELPQTGAQRPQQVFSAAQKKTHPDMEKVIGKAWMGILASVLIFASLIFFAAVLIPLLTETVKLVVMYGLSIGFLALGLVLLYRRNNAVNVAVSSCGLGALYLSMLLSNTYFHVLNDVALYLFIFVWAIGVAYLSRTKSRVFLIIGQLGIVISVILGVVLCARTGDHTKLFILAVFFLLSAIVYELFNREQKLINASFDTVSYVILAVYSVSSMELPYLTMGLLIVVSVLQVISCAVRKVKPFAVFDIIYVLFGWILVNCLLREQAVGDYGCGFFMYAIAVLNIAAAHMLFREKMSNGSMIAISIFNTCAMAAAFIDLNPCLYILLVPLVLMCLGFALDALAYKMESYAALALLSLYGFVRRGSVAACLLEIVFLIGALAASEFIAAKYSVPMLAGTADPEEGVGKPAEAWSSAGYTEWIKIVTFLFLNFSLFRVVQTGGRSLRVDAGLEFSIDIDYLVLLVLWLVNNLVFKFVLNKKNERPLRICTYASSALMMAVATEQLYDIYNSGVIYYLTLLIAAAIFANNTYRFIRSGDIKYQLYGTIKVTAFLVIVLTSMQRASILLSVALLVLAILWILAGFELSAKAIRMYGLVITNISIVKLILIDITYNGSLGKAIGFFICGILCFAISFIYSMIDKSYGEKPEEPTLHS
jgi:hypothetical protein